MLWGLDGKVLAKGTGFAGTGVLENGRILAETVSMTARQAMERPTMTMRQAGQTHECGLGNASKYGPVFRAGRNIGVKTALYQEVSAAIGVAGQRMGGIRETRIINPTWQRGQRAAGSTMRAKMEATWAAVGSNPERAPASSSRQRARFPAR